MALKDFVQGFSERTGIDVTMDIAPDFGRLPSDAEIVLFRVVQEALANISRHSGSSTARIRLAIEHVKHRKSVTLAITDNGRGMRNIADGAG